jgi:hypothetical protein
MEVPPSELARIKWVQARNAAAAGTQAWQSGVTAHNGASAGKATRTCRTLPGQRLRDGRAGAGYLRRPLDATGRRTVPIGSEPKLACLPVTHPLARR